MDRVEGSKHKVCLKCRFELIWALKKIPFRLTHYSLTQNFYDSNFLHYLFGSNSERVQCKSGWPKGSKFRGREWNARVEYQKSRPVWVGPSVEVNPPQPRWAFIVGPEAGHAECSEQSSQEA